MIKKRYCVLLLVSMFYFLGNAYGEKAAKAAKEAVDKGIEYKRAGRYGEAIAEFDKAVALAPNDTKIFYVQGLTYESRHNSNQADISDSNKVSGIDNNLSGVYKFLGSVYSARGDYDQAILCFNKASQFNPDDSSLKNTDALF